MVQIEFLTLNELRELIREIVSYELDKQGRKPIMDIKEASKYLSISSKTMYKWIQEKKIPCYRPSGKVYFKLQELENFIFNENTRYMSEEEMEREAETRIALMKLNRDSFKPPKIQRRRKRRNYDEEEEEYFS